MSIRKLTNRVKKMQNEFFGFGGSIIPKEEQILVAVAKLESEADRIFETLKGKLREKYGDFPDEEVQCIWCRKFGTSS